MFYKLLGSLPFGWNSGDGRCASYSTNASMASCSGSPSVLYSWAVAYIRAPISYEERHLCMLRTLPRHRVVTWGRVPALLQDT